LIDLIEATLSKLEFYTKQIPSEVLEKEINILFASDIYKKYYSDSLKENYNLASYKMAAYIAVSQLIIYSILQKEVPKLKLSRIGKITHPSQLADLFLRTIDKINFKIIFCIDIASKLPLKSKNVINDFIQAISDLKLEKLIMRDLLGHIFQRLIPLTLRRQISAFYTLPEAAKFLACLAIDNKEAIIGDIACGSGTLLVQSYNRLKNLGRQSHKRLLQQLWGSDISPFACELAIINLAFQSPLEINEACNIILEDAFKLRSDEYVSFIDEELYLNKEIQMERDPSIGKTFEKSSKLPYFDVLISNPPFTRGKRITSKYRDFLYGIMPAHIEFDKIGIHACFLLYASKLLKSNGILAFILPNSVTFAQAMISVIREFQKVFSIKYLIRSEVDKAFSDSELQEIILIAQKDYEGDAKIINLKKTLVNASDLELNELISIIKNKTTRNNDKISLRTIPYSKLKKTIVWKDLFLISTIFDKISKNFVPFFEYATSFQYHDPRPKECFRIPNKYWSITKDAADHILLQNTENGKIFTIDKSFLTKTVHLLREAMSLDLSPMFKESDLQSYFFLGHKSKKNGDAEEYWNLNHKKWKEYENQVKFGKLSKNPLGRWSVQANGFNKKRSRLMLVRKINLKNNRSIVFFCDEPVLVSSGFYGVHIKNPEFAELLFAYLSSSIFLLDFLYSRRIESGSVGQLLPKDLESRLVPNFEQIEHLNRDAILTSSKAWNSILLSKRSNYLNMILKVKENKNHPLRKLDEAWLRALDITLSGSSEEELISELYGEIVKKLEQFRQN
jgi:methylase of polypeptide subunit release factors